MPTMLRPALLPLLLCLTAASQAADRCQLSIVTDRPEAVYHRGEMVRFLVTVKSGGKTVTQGNVIYRLDLDGAKELGRGTATLGEQPTVIEGSLAEPGFLQCLVGYVPTAEEGEKPTPISTRAAAAVDPLAIKPSLPVPNDFDAFWAAQKARLAKVPLQPKLVWMDPPDDAVECYNVEIPCVGPRPVSGYLARPVDAKPKSLPAILHVHGAGVGSSNLGTAVAAAKLGALSLDINAHGIPNGKPREFYEALAAGELKDYRFAGRESRDSCYFLGMFLRLQRALDFLAAQPQWNGRVLCVAGHSQGGGQALAAAGLDPRVTFIAAGVPAICDHTGKAAGRINGWPKLVPDQEGKPDPQILQVSRYFDGMNFATRTKAEAIVSVGFIDTVCPPTSVYAAYNNLAGKKQMITKPLMAHRVTPDIVEAFNKALWAHVKAHTQQ
jgi:cephalosporin-C deacetylase-like acetyl esterase